MGKINQALIVLKSANTVPAPITARTLRRESRAASRCSLFPHAKPDMHILNIFFTVASLNSQSLIFRRRAEWGEQN